MKKFKQAANAQILPLDEEESVIMTASDGDIHYVNKIASIIFSLFENPCAKETALQTLCEMFEGDAETIRGEGGSMIDTFCEKGLLVEVTGSENED